MDPSTDRQQHRTEEGAASVPDASTAAAAGDPASSPAARAEPGWTAEDLLGAERDRGARTPTRRRLAVAALVLAAAVIASVVVLGGGPGKHAPPATGVPAGDTTATVSRRTLTESASVDGTLGYGAAAELYDRLSGTFTWLPAVGATIARGGTLFRVDDLPVVLMYGQVPAYRALKEGVSDGPDVAELNENLIDLGYDPYGAITDVSHYGEATAGAVRRWQKAEGLKDTGEVELGRVIFAPSARRITTVHVTLGQDPPPSAAGAPQPNAPSKAAGPTGKKGKPKRHDKAPSKATGKPASSKEKAKEGKPKQGKEPEGNSGDGASKEPGASSAAQAELVLSTTSTQQLVQLKLKAEQQQLAHVGELAPVALPGGGAVKGRIVEVGTVASEASGAGEKGEKGAANENSGEATIPVTLALTRRVPRLDEAPVSVELVKSVQRNVLAVPATALFATAGDRYAIEVLDGDRPVQVAVTPGMFANGYVQVEGPGLHEGQTVIEAE